MTEENFDSLVSDFALINDTTTKGKEEVNLADMIAEKEDTPTIDGIEPPNDAIPVNVDQLRTLVTTAKFNATVVGDIARRELAQSAVHLIDGTLHEIAALNGHIEALEKVIDLYREKDNEHRDTINELENDLFDRDQELRSYRDAEQLVEPAAFSLQAVDSHDDEDSIGATLSGLIGNRMVEITLAVAKQ